MKVGTGLKDWVRFYSKEQTSKHAEAEDLRWNSIYLSFVSLEFQFVAN